MTRIVTSTYRYKRPPRKRKAVPLEGPAIVTPRRTAAPASVPRRRDAQQRQPIDRAAGHRHREEAGAQGCRARYDAEEHRRA